MINRFENRALYFRPQTYGEPGKKCDILFFMTRRHDAITAEKVDMALLTRAAFEVKTAGRYAAIAGLPGDLIEQVFARPVNCTRQYSSLSRSQHQADRRNFSR